MNILCFSADGIEYYMLEELARRGFTVYLGIDKEKKPPAFAQHCIPVELPRCRSKISPVFIAALRRMIRRKRIDVIFSQASAALSNALFASWGLPVKNIGYRGTQAPIRRIDPTYYLAVLNPRVSHVVCETEDIRQYMMQFLPEQNLTCNTKPFEVEWVHEAFERPESVPGVPADAFKIIYIANTKGRPHKGLAILTEAMKRLDTPRVHLTFIGNFDQSIYRDIRRSGLEDRVHFLGMRRDAVHFLPGQDVFVLPSTRDASPRTVREAMACGLPCIVSNIPGSRDLIVPGRTGLLTEPGSAESLADNLRLLMENEALRKSFGKASQERIIRDFSMKRYVDAYEKIFTRIAKEKSAS